MVVASLARLSYAAGLLVAPHTMSRWQLGAETRGNPVATMTSRGFGAAHVNLSLLSLRAALSGRDKHVTIGLNLGPGRRVALKARALRSIRTVWDTDGKRSSQRGRFCCSWTSRLRGSAPSGPGGR